MRRRRSAEQRYGYARRYVLGDETAEEVASVAGVHPVTVYRWAAEWRQTAEGSAAEAQEAAR